MKDEYKEVKAYILNNQEDIINMIRSELGVNDPVLKFIEYKEANRGFSGFPNKIELVGYDNDSISSMTYLVISDNKIRCIGMGALKYEKVHDYVISLKRELIINSILS
tara:strand:+ start:748 stop:1071 length:324 start_codon:yes stop_codon:yes gene_type:complete